MDKKHFLPVIIGTIFFLGGVSLLLGTLAIWLLAPNFVPQPYRSAAANDRLINSHLQLPDTQALSPYTPAAEGFATAQEPMPPAIPADENNAAVPTLPSSSYDSGWSLNPNWYDNHPPQKNTNETSNQMRLVIPAIGVNAPVLPVSMVTAATGDHRSSQQWTVPDQYAAGWHDSSAPPGQPGNTVFNGHNNIYGAVFHDLVDLPLGSEIQLLKGNQTFLYQVTGREFLEEQDQPLRTRLRNARWILPTADERLTLVTCWPNSSNSHRLVVIAQPVHTS